MAAREEARAIILTTGDKSENSVDALINGVNDESVKLGTTK